MTKRQRARHTSEDADGTDGTAAICVHLDRVLAERHMTLAELSDLVGVTVVNLSVLKNGRARAIRFSTLAGLCEVLDCQPGDLLAWEPGNRGSQRRT